ncbi:ABC transporter permease subunit, partial [Paraburkholderia sp. SIMBA_009]
MEALDLVIHTLPVMVKGALLTLKFAVASMALGLVVALLVAIMRIGSNRLASGLAQGYVSLMRGTP